MAFDTEYDLVVVGGGASGKSAALEAARAGKSVVILEKMPETGGLSMFAEGTAAFESSEQKKLGKPAHPDRHFPTKQEGYDKFNAYSHYRANFDVVRAFVDNSADTIDFLKDLGVEYKTVTIAAYDDPNEVWTFHLPTAWALACRSCCCRPWNMPVWTSSPRLRPPSLSLRTARLWVWSPSPRASPCAWAARPWFWPRAHGLQPRAHCEVFLVRAQRLQHEHPHAAAEHG